MIIAAFIYHFNLVKGELLSSLIYDNPPYFKS